MKVFRYFIFICVVFGVLTAISHESFAVNTYKKETLPNGLTVLIKHNPDSKVFAINVLAKGRSILEPSDKAGISEIVNRMLIKGAGDYTAAELARAFDMHGVKLTLHDNPYIPYDDRYTSRDFAFIKMETIDEYATGAVDLLSIMISKPTFPVNEVEDVRRAIMGILGMNKGSTYKTARNLFYSEMFEGTSYDKEILGSMRTIGSITKEDIEDFYKILYAPENLIIAVVSNIPIDRCSQMITEAFGNMQSSGYEYPEYPVLQPVKKIVKTHQKMDKDQVYIYLGNIVPGLGDPDYPALVIGSSALSTRLGLELREKQGLAYSVGAGLGSYPGFGMFYCVMGTGYQNYNKSLRGIKGEIGKIRSEGITEKERDNIVNSLWGSMLTRNLSRANQAYYMAAYEYLGVGYQYWDQFIDDLRKVTVREVQLTAEKYFPENSYILATVGKK
ncbi:MAG: insulinase family protein [candidate division Zixibacteria bacterium]|nr:insulinase family protein [candidate division Zixibacteria bacterium]